MHVSPALEKRVKYFFKSPARNHCQGKSHRAPLFLLRGLGAWIPIKTEASMLLARCSSSSGGFIDRTPHERSLA